MAGRSAVFVEPFVGSVLSSDLLFVEGSLEQPLTDGVTIVKARAPDQARKFFRILARWAATPGGCRANDFTATPSP